MKRRTLYSCQSRFSDIAIYLYSRIFALHTWVFSVYPRNSTEIINVLVYARFPEDMRQLVHVHNHKMAEGFLDTKGL